MNCCGLAKPLKERETMKNNAVYSLRLDVSQSMSNLNIESSTGMLTKFMSWVSL